MLELIKAQLISEQPKEKKKPKKSMRQIFVIKKIKKY